jgi:hypothetical protein
MQLLRYLQFNVTFWLGAGLAIVGTGLFVGAFAASRTEWPLVLVGAPLALAGWPLAILGVRRACSRLRLIRTGLPTLGTVTAIEIERRVRINNRHPLYLSYSYEDDRSRARRGRTVLLPRGLEDRWAPGDGIVVVFDPMDPSRSEADVFGVLANATGVPTSRT